MISRVTGLWLMFLFTKVYFRSASVICLESWKVSLFDINIATRLA